MFLQVPSYESETFDSGTIWAEPGTLIARGGPEKGVPHHFFKKDELLAMFPGYATKKIHSNSEPPWRLLPDPPKGKNRCTLAEIIRTRVGLPIQ